jgi:cytochrome c biogenesis protein CcdA/thiol-disulfide isomerase/thioredoxin
MLYLLAFLGGVLTIFSPCVLPVLPFVFAQTGVSFRKSGLPMLLGMGFSFSIVAALAAVGGSWVVQLNQIGRIVAIVIVAILGASLLFPSLAALLTRPFVRLGNRLQQGRRADSGFGSSLVLGVATGLLWTPCAGPILGLLLTGAAIHGNGLQTWPLLLIFALGAACPLALALLAGGKIFQAMKQSLGAEEWVRRALGVLVLLGAGAIAFGWDRGLLTRLSLGSGPMRLEQYVLAKTGMSKAESGGVNLTDEGQMTELSGAIAWINSPPLTREALLGKVVVIDFWTYSCINCLRALPYVQSWSQKYADSGLVVIGVHSPEFAFEREESNVEQAVRDLGIHYPVANDANRVIWQAFGNHYWPAHYFIDIRGHIRAHHFGEGDYDGSEKIIQRLLAERNGKMFQVEASAQGQGIEAPASLADVKSPETYIGYDRQDNLMSPEDVTQDAPAEYSRPADFDLNDWALVGRWTVGAEQATLDRAPGSIVFRFHARDVHLVLGPPANGMPVRFRVKLDGQPVGDAHGVDVDAAGNGVVKEQRLYQLIRQKGEIQDRTIEIEFLDPGVQAYSFTFG